MGAWKKSFWRSVQHWQLPRVPIQKENFQGYIRWRRHNWWAKSVSGLQYIATFGALNSEKTRSCSHLPNLQCTYSSYLRKHTLSTLPWDSYNYTSKWFSICVGNLAESDSDNPALQFLGKAYTQPFHEMHTSKIFCICLGI